MSRSGAAQSQKLRGTGLNAVHSEGSGSIPANRGRGRRIAVLSAVVGLFTVLVAAVAFRKPLLERATDFLEDLGVLEPGEATVTRVYPISDLVGTVPGRDEFPGEDDEGITEEENLVFMKGERLLYFVTRELKDRNEELVGEEPTIRFKIGELTLTTTSGRQRAVRALLARLRRLTAEGKTPLGKEGTGLSP